MLRGRSVRHVARRAGLLVLSTDEPEEVRLVGHVLHVGPGACDRAVLMIAYRRWLEQHGEFSDIVVRAHVDAHLGVQSERLDRAGAEHALVVETPVGKRAV